MLEDIPCLQLLGCMQEERRIMSLLQNEENIRQERAGKILGGEHS